jgi:hypothetical protein
MRADAEGGSQFYSHLRNAYEAFERGEHAQAERSITVALGIDPDVLVAWDLWNLFREKRETVSASDCPSAVPEATHVETAVGAAPWALNGRARQLACAALLAVAALPVFPRAYRVLDFSNVPPPSAANVATIRMVRIASPRPNSSPLSRPVDAKEPDGGTRWLSPQIERLGVRPRWRAAAIGLDRKLLSELQQSVGELWVGRAANDHDAIILGVSGVSDLAQLPSLGRSLKAGGVLWVLHDVHDRAITRNAIADAVHDSQLSYVTSTRLTSTAIAHKLVRSIARAPARKG